MAAESSTTSSSLPQASTTAAASLWRVTPDTDLLWRVWDDETTVYHTRSGDTHLLNPLAAAALELLQQRPATCPQIIEHVATLFALKADGELVQQMEACLSQFDHVGLIESLHVSE